MNSSTAYIREFHAFRHYFLLCVPPRVARFSTTKYGRFLSVDPSKSSPPNVSIYNSVHVAIGYPDTNSTQAVNTAKILIGLK